MTRKDEAQKSHQSPGGAPNRASPGRAAPRTGVRANVLHDLMTELTLRERLVLGLRYADELTVVEIAAVLEVAATEVERMLDSIAERVRRKLQPTYVRPAPRLA